MNAEDKIEGNLGAALDAMKAAYATDRAPSVSQRTARLNRLQNAVLTYKDRLIAAVDADFGGRAKAETLLTETLPILEGIHYTKKNLKSWMKPSRRRVPLGLMGARAKVHTQPLGVIGIVVPWNFPIFLGLSPLIGALAAGNRAMIKTSEFAPQTGAVIQKMIAASFSPDEVAVYNGGVEVATEFTKLPFDHLVFTGSTQVGRIVMRAAADNLTPVTLELGGKSPAIIHPSFPIEEAAKRLAFGKGLNAGQVCISPDYILLPNDKVDAFTRAFQTAFVKLYPTLKQNPDVTSIITSRQRDRLLDVIKDAEAKGAKVITINPGQETFDDTGKLPMHIVHNVTDDMRIMQEEIFGPLLPIVPYDALSEALAFVNARPRALALYYFDWNTARAEKVLAETHSGGVCINDTMLQVAVDDMPFGGIGPSGMGHYHGKEGFLNFSKAKAVVRKGRFNATEWIQAPWGNRYFDAYLRLQLWRFRKVN